MSKFIFLEPTRYALTLAICEKAGIEPDSVRRMVIDLQVGDPAMVYIQSFADDSVLDVSIAELGVDVVAAPGADA